MALLVCEECERKVSDKAAACPHCGAPVIAETGNTPPADPVSSNSASQEKADSIDLRRLGTPSKAAFKAMAADPTPPVTSETDQAETKKAGLMVRPFMAGCASWVFGLVFAALAIGSTKNGEIGLDTFTAAIVACLLLPPTRWLIGKITKIKLTRTHLVMASIAGVFIVMINNGETETATGSSPSTKSSDDGYKAQSVSELKAAKAARQAKAAKEESDAVTERNREIRAAKKAAKREAERRTIAESAEKERTVPKKVDICRCWTEPGNTRWQRENSDACDKAISIEIGVPDWTRVNFSRKPSLERRLRQMETDCGI